MLDPAKMRVLVLGDGVATTRRKELLKEADATFDYAANASAIEDYMPYDVVFAADFDDSTSAIIYHAAKQAGALVNVEDKKAYCDFHVPAMVRRGELLLTISTGGASPRLARRLRMMLESLFPPSWSEHLQLIGQKRTEWKAAGAGFTEVAEKTDALLEEQGWLTKDCACLRMSEER
jgi:precorrin-2 dehydrogenase/sirohydrochlorin ferrochelatase